MTSCFSAPFVRDLFPSEHFLKPPHLPAHNLKGSLPLPSASLNPGHFTKSTKIFQVIFKNELQGDFSNQINDVCVKNL